MWRLGAGTGRRSSWATRLKLTMPLVATVLLVAAPAALAAGPGGSLSQLPFPNDCVQQAGQEAPDCGSFLADGMTRTQDTVVSPDGRNVYVLGGSDHAIAEFARNQDGSLTQLASPNDCIASPPPGDSSNSTCPQQTATGLDNPQAIAISPDGKNVYVAAHDTHGVGTIAEFARNPDGSLQQLSPNDCIAENIGQTDTTSDCANQSGHGINAPAALAVSPDGQSVYVADQSGQALAEFSRNPSGSLSQLNGANDCIADPAAESTDCATTANGLGAVMSVVVSPDGNNVYTGGFSNNNEAGEIAEFARSSDGSLTQLPAPHNCVEEQGNDLGCGTTGIGFAGLIGLAMSPDGRNIYSASQQFGGPIAEFARNSDGSLSQLPAPNDCIQEGADFGCGTQGTGIESGFGLKVSPDGANVYSAAPAQCSGGCDAVAEFARNAADGALTQLAAPNDCVQEHGQDPPDCGNALGTGLGGSQLAISPDSANVYVVGGQNNSIAEFSRAPAPVLSVGLSGSGGGTVTDNTGHISCPGTCSQAYSPGTQVTLHAAPSNGSTFAGWSGGGCAGSGDCHVTMNADTNVTATFNQVQNPPPGAQPPGVNSGPPSVLSSSTASFSGQVNPENQATTAYYRYGLDARYSPPGTRFSYTNSTPTEQVGSDASQHSVSASVSGLVPNALYHVQMVAANGTGTTFGPDLTFTTRQDPAPPPPVLGQSFDIKLVSGLVFIKAPNGQSLGTASDRKGAADIVKGQGFVPLTEARQIPAGSQIDARLGTLSLTAAASTSHGKLQTGVFGQGVFRPNQANSGLAKGLTTLSLLEGVITRQASFRAVCPRTAAYGALGVRALSSRVLNTLRSRARGRFTTRGHFSAATVRGTVWDTIDRCDGTLTIVHRGTVSVRDYVRHVTVLVHAGHSYLARAQTR